MTSVLFTSSFMLVLLHVTLKVTIQLEPFATEITHEQRHVEVAGEVTSQGEPPSKPTSTESAGVGPLPSVQSEMFHQSVLTNKLATFWAGHRCLIVQGLHLVSIGKMAVLKRNQLMVINPETKSI